MGRVSRATPIRSLGAGVLALVAIPGIQYIFHSVPVLKRFRRFAEARAASTAMCGPYHAHDVALSLLRMVSNNIGHIGCLSAQQCGLRHIVFGGSFIRDHPYTLATISSAVHFFSGGQVRALFLKHDGFVGAIGALGIAIDKLIEVRAVDEIDDAVRLEMAGPGAAGAGAGAGAAAGAGAGAWAFAGFLLSSFLPLMARLRRLSMVLLCRQGQPSALKSRGGERGANGPLIPIRRMILAAMQQCGASRA